MMHKGPFLNNINRNFTTRDSLGIEGVVTSLQGEICPIVNTVTPRAFYWPFMAWIYYDFLRYSGITNRTVTTFDAYLKRQDYFFVLAVLLTEGSDQNNLVGKQQSQIDINDNPEGPYPFNNNYFITRYGGMQYYNAGCLSMYFITDQDADGKDLAFPLMRPEGEEIAKAFEDVIKNTEYYKNYRLNDKPVPKSVLLEYGKVINIGLKRFDKCKSLLRMYLFEDTRNQDFTNRSRLLAECADYIKTITDQFPEIEFNSAICRKIFFDKRLLDGSTIQLPERLISVSNKWEIVAGRMYFTSGVEMLWKYMLEQLSATMTLSEWFESVIKKSDFSWNINDSLSTVLDGCIFEFDAREEMIAATTRRGTSSYSIENGIKIILSVFNRFYDRNDLAGEISFINSGKETRSIALSEMIEVVEKYEEKTIKEFILFIMQNWIIKQHIETAYEKLMMGRDGFYFEQIDGKYVRKHEFGMAFQGIRLVQLSQVMKDLDML